METFEKLGSFYLGKLFDLDSRAPRDELLLYDCRDLTTHAVCVGMTGSGKTGLCLALLEEAAIDGIPAIAIDPKGDLGNLLLTFPDLAPEDFRPWLDESAAARKGITPDEMAAETAKTWREGLAAWGQSPQRIARFRESVDLAIYTPGSNAGLPLTVLRSFAAPPQEVIDDSDAFRQRISSSASGLLSLLGIDADPVRSREHILISNLLDHAWRRGRDLDIAALIGAIQSPPIEKVGVLDVETFYPAKQRAELAMSLNNLLASPAFAGWMEGEPLDVKRLFHTPEGKPRLSILSIAHLSEAERMFFVTILLGEVLAWTRSQPGTSSLRALLYMDEVYGYFPPVANPPSKTPMLTLLKQARAYGLGCVLATQNPVDLDYKGLSNTGTWLLGRLQTERDKARVLEGLEGASAQAGAAFDRQKMEATLAGLGNRVFLMNNVHEDRPVVFQTRWAMSYLRGPLTRSQIQTLMAPRKGAQEKSREAEAPVVSPLGDAPADKPKPADDGLFADLVPAVPAAPVQADRPRVPQGVEEHFLPCRRPAGEGARIRYRAALLGRGRLHFVRKTWELDAVLERARLLPVGGTLPDDPWQSAESTDGRAIASADRAEAGAEFVPLPEELTRENTYAQLARKLQDHLYQNETVTIWKCPALKQFSRADETEGEFRVRLMDLAREQRDRQVEKLRDDYGSKLAKLRDRIDDAEDRLKREESEYREASVGSVFSVGTSILGALLGRKLVTRTNVSKMNASAKSVGRAARQRDDVGRAEDKLRELQSQLAEMDEQFQAEADKIERAYHPAGLELESLEVSPRKGDLEVDPVAVVWMPSKVAGSDPSA